MTYHPPHAYEDFPPDQQERVRENSERAEQDRVRQLDQDVRHSPAPEAPLEVRQRVQAVHALAGLVSDVEATVSFLRKADTGVADAAAERLEVACGRPREVLAESRYWI